MVPQSGGFLNQNELKLEKEMQILPLSEGLYYYRASECIAHLGFNKNKSRNLENHVLTCKTCGNSLAKQYQCHEYTKTLRLIV